MRETVQTLKSDEPTQDTPPCSPLCYFGIICRVGKSIVQMMYTMYWLTVDILTYAFPKSNTGFPLGIFQSG